MFKMEKLVVLSWTHGHLYLLLGEDRVGEDDDMCQVWQEALGRGWED